MTDDAALTGQWVEILERGDADQIVLMRADANVPASRGGRRQLEIARQGQLQSSAQGPTDRLETAAKGRWTLQGDTLHLNIDGWEGDYVVETMTDTELILKRR
ncbi:MAG: lipocalin family protein [Hyphomicrobiales bacterium]|nr:lipocalin family protein [Hyphomicrobiales bacterium]